MLMIEEAKAAEPNPLKLLTPGRLSVILGDPGTGKSTALKFLSLVGSSRALQDRYSAPADGRLPLVVTLRRYSDELKDRHNLPILDYIMETVNADLNVDIDKQFLEYFLLTGQAVLFLVPRRKLWVVEGMLVGSA